MPSREWTDVLRNVSRCPSAGPCSALAKRCGTLLDDSADTIQRYGDLVEQLLAENKALRAALKATVSAGLKRKAVEKPVEDAGAAEPEAKRARA